MYTRETKGCEKGHLPAGSFIRGAGMCQSSASRRKAISSRSRSPIADSHGSSLRGGGIDLAKRIRSCKTEADALVLKREKQKDMEKRQARSGNVYIRR